LEYQTSYVTEAVVPLIGTEVGVAEGGTLKVLPSNTATPVFCPFPTKYTVLGAKILTPAPILLMVNVT
jgi:hypothetical protein